MSLIDLVQFFLMSLKTKIMSIITAHPKLVTFGIWLGITFVIGTTIGIIDQQQAQEISQHNFANN